MKKTQIVYILILLVLISFILFQAKENRELEKDIDRYVDFWLDAEDQIDIMSEFITYLYDKNASVNSTTLSTMRTSTGSYNDAVRWKCQPDGYYIYVTREGLYVTDARDGDTLKVY